MTTWEINLVRFGVAGACCLSISAALHARDYCYATTGEGQRLVDALYGTNQPPANAPPTLHGAAAAAQAAQSSQTG